MIEENTRLSEVIQRYIKNELVDIHTSTVARVTAVKEKTINCKVVIPKVVRGEVLEMPEFIEVPVVFMQGGNSYTAHPIAVGDYCLLVFAERCFDAWWAGVDDVEAPEFRMHDYSDGFAIVGINPNGSSITIPDVITEVGDKYSEGNHEHNGNTTTTGNIDAEGNITSDGNVDASTYSVGGTSGATGTFTNQAGNTLTIKNGLITNIT